MVEISRVIAIRKDRNAFEICEEKLFFYDWFLRPFPFDGVWGSCTTNSYNYDCPGSCYGRPNFTSEPTSSPEPTLTPLPEIELNPKLPEGNPEKGYITAIRFSCLGCHTDDDHPEKAPRFVAYDDLPNIFERGEVRIADPEYKGRATSSYEYIIESILLPEAYFVAGEWPNTMSTFTIKIIEDQELADILAWMETLE